jgi:hypothetical protein
MWLHRSNVWAEQAKERSHIPIVQTVGFVTATISGIAFMMSTKNSSEFQPILDALALSSETYITAALTGMASLYEPVTVAISRGLGSLFKTNQAELIAVKEAKENLENVIRKKVLNEEYGDILSTKDIRLITTKKNDPQTIEDLWALDKKLSEMMGSTQDLRLG